MACEVLTQGGYYDGDAVLDVAVVDDFVGGSPLVQGANGVSLAKVVAGTGFVGIARNMKSYETSHDFTINDAAVPAARIKAPADATEQDTLVLKTSVTVIKGTCKVRFFADGTDGVPYVWPGSGGAWAAGDRIFITVAGKWDNTAAAGSPSYGTVIKPPTADGEEMIVDFSSVGTDL